MSICNRCLRAVTNKNTLFSKSFKNETFKISHRRLFFSKKKEPQSPNIELDKRDTLTGYNDPKFTDLYLKSWNDLKVQKEGFVNLCNEFKLLYEEAVESFQDLGERVDDREGRIDMLFKFERAEDINRFLVTTDKDFNSGYSSASLTLTDNRTGIFSGNISHEAPKSAPITRPGFANMNSRKEFYAFYRKKLLDLSEYTHLVFKIRGDGRLYFILLYLPNDFTETSHLIFKYPLYTRGGPYWQIAKLPLQYFFLTKKGRMFKQDDLVPLHNLTNIGITVAVHEGPFKLEIDYIGLEFKKYQKAVTPYEEYNRN